jgi:hypothetical protein
MIRKVAFTFIILGLLFRAYQMRHVAFYDWDEGFYAEVAQEILHFKSLQARFNGDIWLDKPALSHYQFATIFAVTKEQDHELYARMLMVGYAVIMLGFTYLLNRRLVNHFFSKEIQTFSTKGREFVYLIPVLVTASTPLFLERSTQLNTDTILSVAWLGYFLTYDRFWWKLFFICFGTFSKSLVGLYPLGFEILNTKKIRISKQNIFKAVALVVTPLAWHIYSFLKFGQSFINEHVYDQVIKRVMVPIELHFGFTKMMLFGKEYEFGEKVFYPLTALTNFNVLSIVIAIGFIMIVSDLLDVRANKLNFKALWNRLIRVYKSDSWMQYLILFSPVPFFLLLALSKSKISWYFTTIIPLFALTIPYVFLRIKNKWMQNVLGFIVITMFVIRFIPQTYALKVTSDNRNDRIRVGQCINKLPEPEVAQLVDAQERQTQNVLEAAHLQAKSSFIHGGSTSFVYYSNKKIHFYYKVDEFIRDIDTHKLVIISKDDLANPALLKVSEKLKMYNKETQCYFGPWEVYSRQ